MSWFSKKIRVDEREYCKLISTVHRLDRESEQEHCAHEPVLFLDHYVYCKRCSKTLSTGTEYENAKYMANHFKEMRKKYKIVLKDIKRTKKERRNEKL